MKRAGIPPFSCWGVKAVKETEEIIEKEISLIRKCTVNKGELVNFAVIDSEIWDGFFDGTTIRDTRWGDAVFNNVYLDGADLSHMSMKGAHFNLVNMRDVTIEDLSMAGSTFKDATLSGSTLERVDFRNAKIISSDLKGIEITDCGYDGMTIEGVAVEKLIEAYNTLNPEQKIILK